MLDNLEFISDTARSTSAWVFASLNNFNIDAVSLRADIANTSLAHSSYCWGIQIIQISCCWGITGTTSPDVVKSRHTTRNDAAVSMAELFLPRWGHRVVRLTIRLSDNHATTLHVDWYLWRHQFHCWLMSALFKVNFVMRWMRLCARGTVKSHVSPYWFGWESQL